MKPDARAAKVHAALARLQLSLDYQITRTGPLEPVLTCLNVVHASAVQLDSLNSLEVHIEMPQHTLLTMHSTARELPLCCCS